MDERRDRPAGAAPRAPLIAAYTSLSPVQEAWGRFAEHVNACSGCRSIDAPACEDAEELYRAYQATGDAAYRQLTGQSVRPPG